MDRDMVTCSFKMDRDTYNQYKSIVARNGENVKGNLVRHMQEVIKYETPNEETLEAIREVAELKKNPNKKGFHSFAELLKDMDL